MTPARAWRAAKLTVAAAVCLVLVAWSTACTPSALQQQAAAANAIGLAVDASVPVLVRFYDAACGPEADKGPAPLAACKARWRPVWQAIDALAAAQRAWIDALAVGGLTDWPALLRVACDLASGVRAVAPEALPTVIGALCPPQPVAGLP